MTSNFAHSDLTHRIIGCYFQVYNRLGWGFLEKVYGNAFVHEFNAQGISWRRQCPVRVFYKSSEIGFYIADFVIEESVIVEIKAAESLCQQHEAQLTNYLRATAFEVGLLLNFGKAAEWKRKVFSNTLKQHSPS